MDASAANVGNLRRHDDVGLPHHDQRSLRHRRLLDESRPDGRHGRSPAARPAGDGAHVQHPDCAHDPDQARLPLSRAGHSRLGVLRTLRGCRGHDGEHTMKKRCWILRIATTATGLAVLIGTNLIGYRLPTALGYCLNLTPSEPVGIYRLVKGGAERGALVWLK